MNPMAKHLFPCISANVGHYLGEKNLSSKIQYTTAALIYISLIINEVQYFFSMFVSYLDFFFFSKMSICVIYLLSPWGFILLFIDNSSLHIKNPFGKHYHKPFEANYVANIFSSLSCSLFILCVVLLSTHQFVAKSITAFVFGFWHCVDA